MPRPHTNRLISLGNDRTVRLWEFGQTSTGSALTNNLDHRWLALPEGRHRLTVHVDDAAAVERRVDVAPGKSQVVRLGPFPRAAG